MDLPPSLTRLSFIVALEENRFSTTYGPILLYLDP